MPKGHAQKYLNTIIFLKTYPMNFLEKFNDTFREMIQDLVNVFPQDSELRMYKLGLEAVLFADPRVISRVFYNEVSVPYQAQIAKEDESFFLEKDYQEFGHYESAGDIVRKLKGCWTELSDDNKSVIWRYFKVLSVLSQKIEAS